MDDYTGLLLVGAILLIGVSIKCMVTFFQHFYKKRKYHGSAVGKVVGTEFDAQATTYRRRGRTYENPYETSIAYRAVIEYEGRRATCQFTTKESIPEGIDVYVKYDLNNPEDFYLPDYQDVSPIFSILGVILSLAGAVILYKIFTTIM